MLVVPAVFVSSTRQDLEDYRDALLANLPRFDVVYRGMEVFGARASAPIEVMMGEVEQSDLFLGILGNRYGSEDSTTGLSYTQLEYERAKELAKPMLMFVIDESMPGPGRGASREDDAKWQKLQQFRKAVQSENTTSSFTTPDDLVVKVAQSIRRFLDETEDERAERYVAANLPDEPTKRNLRKLYSSDEGEVIEACRSLPNSGFRQVLEHLYAILRTSTESLAIRQAAFNALLPMPSTCRRVEEILEELVSDRDVGLRRGAAQIVCERARSLERQVARSLAELVLCRTGADIESDAEAREHLAHSLSKIARQWPDLATECRARLEMLCNDESDGVKRRARTGLDDMNGVPNRPRRGRQH